MKEMKIIILALFAMLFLRCTDKYIESEKKSTDTFIGSTEANSKIGSKKQTALVYNNHVDLNIDFIKANSREGFTDFNMDSLWKKELNKIEDTALLTILSEIHINGNEKWTLYTGEYDPLRFYEWEENEELFVFSFLQQDEVCCLTMYLASFNKITNELNISQLALRGGDGGWSTNEHGKRTGFGKFTINGISEEETELKITTETYKIQYNLKADGLLERDTIDVSINENVTEKQ